MAMIKYTGGLSKVIAPWYPRPEVLRGVPVEASDEDAAILTKEEGSPWVYAYAAPVPFTETTADAVVQPEG